MLRACDGLIELGWLVAVVAVPIYFNTGDVRAFEPDKAILLRDLAALLAVLCALRLTLWLGLAGGRVAPYDPGTGLIMDGHGRDRILKGRTSRVGGAPGDAAAGVGAAVPAWLSIWRLLRARPTLLPMFLLTAITLLACATSLLPAASWHGSYARAQGGETTLVYLTFALAALARLRRPRQALRLLAAVALAGVAPASYGWVQHAGLDPLPWQQADLAARVPGTLGNPIFLGALLAMVLPAALFQVALALRAALVPDDPAPDDVPAADGFPRSRVGLVALLPALGWAAVVGLEGGALLFTKSRGPFAGLLAALLVLGAGLGWAWRLPLLRLATLGAAGLGIAGLLGANLLGSGALGPIREGSSLRLVQWTPRASGTSEVRLEIWGPALRLVARRPLLGCGPDALLWCYYPVYPTALRHIEAPNAVPDRTHDLFLDQAAETGLLGLAALLAMLGAAAAALLRAARRAASPAVRGLAVAALAALAGHAAEGLFGMAIVATSLLTWLLVALAGALAAMAEADAAPAARPLASMPPAPARHAATRAAAHPGRAGHRVPQPATARPFAWPRALPGLAALVAAALLARAVLSEGAAATAADVAARQGQGLERVALGNSGQAAVPAGITPRPVLALRQFAAAAADQARAVDGAGDEPAREEYLLDAGTALVEWAQAAGQMGGPAAAQAPDLYVRALVDFGRAARLNPYNPDHLRNTGKAYERWAGLGRDPAKPATWDRGLLARAAEAFARAAVLAPRHPDPLTSEAQVALWQGRDAAALVLLGRALALDPRDGDAYRLRAQAELDGGRKRAALADWRLALADANLGHRGDTAGRLALAEATWAGARCPAVGDARAALLEPDTPDPATMREIIHVDGPRCPGW